VSFHLNPSGARYFISTLRARTFVAAAGLRSRIRNSGNCVCDPIGFLLVDVTGIIYEELRLKLDPITVRFE